MKGIFRKLLLTYLAIISLTIAGLSLTLFHIIQTNLFLEKQHSMLDTARYVSTLLTGYRRGSLSGEELQKAVNTIGETTNSRIIVLGLDNTGGLPKLADEGIADSLAPILKGETILRRRLYSSELDIHVVAVGIPVINGPEVSGAVIIFAPVYHVEKSLGKVKHIIGFTALLSLAVGTAAIYIISRRISGPIIRVSTSAERIARGEKEPDLPGGSRDEVGRLIDSFNNMKNQLEKMEKLRREFLTGISHELRTPLTAVRGFVQGIKDGVISPDDHKKYLDLTLAETARLSSLINDLLELGRLESGSTILDRREINLEEIVGEVTDFMKNMAASKNISLSLSCPIPGNIPVFADGDRIKQVVWNLLANALHYTPPGGTVHIEVFSAKREALVQVKDTGVGIPREELPFVFDTFHRVDKSRDTATGGTGLGLSIAKNIVNLHEGTIHISSQPGKGTLVTVSLPLFNPESSGPNKES